MESTGKPKSGFPLLSTTLGNRWRDSHIPTTLAIARLIRKAKKKGATFGYRPGSPPGSSFDWKTLSSWLPSRAARGSAHNPTLLFACREVSQACKFRC
jgi:hypothetical protein